MSTKADATTSNKLDTFKWFLVVLLLSTGIVSFYSLPEYSLLLRVVGLLGIVGVVTFIALLTDKGRNAKDFLKETHLEVRRVVWPTRQETLQMTGIVLLMVLVVAFLIWALDSVLLLLVRLFTGQGG
jgi:preprotein translocase subunit SecE